MSSRRRPARAQGVDPGACHRGRRALTVDHADVLRSSATQSVVAHRPMAPSTLGTFLRPPPSDHRQHRQIPWARSASPVSHAGPAVLRQGFGASRNALALPARHWRREPVPVGSRRCPRSAQAQSRVPRWDDSTAVSKILNLTCGPRSRWPSRRQARYLTGSDRSSCATQEDSWSSTSWPWAWPAGCPTSFGLASPQRAQRTPRPSRRFLWPSWRFRRGFW